MKQPLRRIDRGHVVCDDRYLGDWQLAAWAREVERRGAAERAKIRADIRAAARALLWELAVVAASVVAYLVAGGI